MPLVFVHGVNNRRGDTPEAQQVFDNRLKFIGQQLGQIALRNQVSAPDGCRPFTPYWGDLGVTFARDLACIPHSEVEALSATDETERPLFEVVASQLDAAIIEEVGTHPDLLSYPLLTLAHMRGLTAAVDLLIGAAATAPPPTSFLSDEDITAVIEASPRVALALTRYSEADPDPPWLQEVQDDDAFLNRLLTEAVAFTAPNVTRTGADEGEVETLGFGNDVLTWLGNAASAVGNAVQRVVSAAGGAVAGAAVDSTRDAFLRLSGVVRPTASIFIGRFFGDVFTYMENRQPIIDRVMIDVEKAVSAQRPGDDKLYLIGHSFGGIILYDILTHFHPNIECELFITVGSQVALFAEIGRLADKERIQGSFARDEELPLSPNIKRWLNVYDSTDLVGFGTAGVFVSRTVRPDSTVQEGVEEFRFETDALPIVSHGAYFDTPRFYTRLHARI